MVTSLSLVHCHYMWKCLTKHLYIISLQKLYREFVHWHTLVRKQCLLITYIHNYVALLWGETCDLSPALHSLSKHFYSCFSQNIHLPNSNTEMSSQPPLQVTAIHSQPPPTVFSSFEFSSHSHSSSPNFPCLFLSAILVVWIVCLALLD